MGKLLIVGSLCLLLGAGIGWYAGYVHPTVKANRDARNYLQSMEVDDSKAAAFAVGTIPLIEDGKNGKAAEKLAKMAGNYYRFYSERVKLEAFHREEREALLRRIDDLSKRYPNLSDALHNGYSGESDASSH